MKQFHFEFQQTAQQCKLRIDILRRAQNLKLLSSVKFEV